VFGGSWGSTLALAYAQTHPERVTELVLRGIFWYSRGEFRWFYETPDGTGALFPDLWEHFVTPIPPEERGDMMRAYYRRLTSDDPAVRAHAARHWSMWEGATSFLRVNPDYVAKFEEDAFAEAFARIECHYFVNGGFLRTPSATTGRRRQDPAHPGRHRPRAIRRRVSDEKRVGFTSRVARGGSTHRR
jgi:proline iminopeptidase